MIENWFKILLALTVSLAPLYGASAAVASEDDLIPQLEQSTTAATTVEISTGALTADSTGTAVTEVSSEAVKLSDYFTTETPAFQNAGQTNLVSWKFRLQYQVNKLEYIVNRMADDGKITGDELHHLKEAVNSYDRLRTSANGKLAFYRLNIPEDERVETYRKLAVIQDGQFSVDDKNESIKRFFVNLTGKDVRVKMGASDKLGMTFIGSVWITILIILL